MKGIYNSHCAKIEVSKENKPIGHINIYHTIKKPFSPKYHELKDKSFKDKLDLLWQEYHKGRTQLEYYKYDLSEVEHYYKILKRYEDCNFDFESIANAVIRVLEMAGESHPELDEIKYDFKKIELIYFNLKKQNEN